MSREVRLYSFVRLIAFFSLSIYVFLIVELNWYLIFLRWEIMGVASFYLIGHYIQRRQANDGAFIALLINRRRDLIFLAFAISNYTVFLIISVIAKSALRTFSRWLPNAMERPTPVSSLLHSSTMVVARVFLILVFDLSVFFFFVYLIVFHRFLIRIIRSVKIDFKRIIAYSTSSQLALVAIFRISGLTYLGFLYIFIHRMFKAIIFFYVRLIVHAVRTQNNTNNVNNNSYALVLIIIFLNMGRWLFISVRRCKDILILDSLLISLLIGQFALTTITYELNYFVLRASNIILSFPLKYIFIGRIFFFFWFVGHSALSYNRLIWRLTVFLIFLVTRAIIFSTSPQKRTFISYYWKRTQYFFPKKAYVSEVRVIIFLWVFLLL